MKSPEPKDAQAEAPAERRASTEAALYVLPDADDRQVETDRLQAWAAMDDAPVHAKGSSGYHRHLAMSSP